MRVIALQPVPPVFAAVTVTRQPTERSSHRERRGRTPARFLRGAARVDLEIGEVAFLDRGQLRRSDFIEARYAFSFVFANFGIAIAAKMPMMTTTIRSSISVKPFRFVPYVSLA